MARFKNVLLVDDNEIDNLINERIIATSKFAGNVTVKNSVDAAISYLRGIGNDADAVPDFIFLDLNMPGRDGFSFLQDFESLPAAVTGKAKVIVVSSSMSSDDINKASGNKHVIKYINKPLSEKYLEAIV
jgi:CheY-like chemotaxis protein